MKRWAAFAIILLLTGGALVLTEKRRPEVPVRPDPVVYFIADTQRELSRLPVSFTRLSDEDEIKIGDQLAAQYASLSGWSAREKESQEVETYVQRVGMKVAGRAHRKLPYKFHYIPDMYFINAFALPGGHVFMGAGLMALMDSEDELAAVLGHEVEHIDHYHCAERVQTEATLRKLPFGGLIALPVEVFEAGYSKDQELEADREGTRLAVLASYSPLGAVRMFEEFDRLFEEHIARARTPQEELSQVTLQTLEGYFRSHPPARQRIGQIREMIAEEHWENLNRERPLEVAYVFWTQRAQRRFLEGRYEAAAKAAAHSLELRPGQFQAIRILAQARFALGDFSAARAGYLELLDKYPAEADAIRAFADELAARALGADHYDQAANFATHSLELQPNQPDALKILAEAHLMRGDPAGAEATYQTLKKLYPDEAEEIITFVNQQASRALEAGRYEQAAKFAAFSLQFTPKDQQAETLGILAQADFALADFEAAAGAYRKILEIGPVDADLVRDYADALGASRQGHKAAKDFEIWTIGLKPADRALAIQARIELAGLEVLAGNDAPANEVIARAKTPGGGGIPPESLGRLAWWFYRAGNYSASSILIHWALEQRPGNLMLQADLAWAELEQHELDDAIQRFTLASSDHSIWYTPTMGRAIARWQAHKPDEALQDFATAVRAEPRWLNQRVVQALYSPLVTQSVQEMQAERQRRLTAARGQ